MKPVFQEIIDPGKGDCFSACLASLLEIPLAAVPKFRRDNPEPRDMMKCARLWLADTFALSIVTIQMEDWDETISGKDLRLIGAVQGTPCIAGGDSGNVPGCFHAVVGVIDRHGMNFEMMHDPNPNGKGIIGRPKHLYFLVPLNSALAINRCARCSEFPVIKAKNNQTGYTCACRGYVLSESEWRLRTIQIYD